jgi:hypothetical protein
MRLERSVFSIRPLSFAFQAAVAGPGGKSAHYRPDFHQKWVCNRPKESYNLAERAPIAFPIGCIPGRPLSLRDSSQVALDRWGGVDPPRYGEERSARKRQGRIQSGIAKVHEPPRTMATACKHPKVRIVSRHEDTSLSSAWSVAKSSIPKSFAIWRLKTPLEPKIFQDDEVKRRAGSLLWRSSDREDMLYFAAAPLAGGGPAAARNHPRIMQTRDDGKRDGGIERHGVEPRPSAMPA